MFIAREVLQVNAVRKIFLLTAIVLLVSTSVRGVELSNADLAASAAAAMSAWEGQVMTVTGLIPADQMGFTLPHEHLLIQHQGATIDLTNESLATSELWWYALAGGKTLVEMTNGGIGRQPAALKRISEATGVQVVMGSGYYKDAWQTPAVRAESVDQIAEDIVRDIVDGVDGIHSGVIGEIGVSGQDDTTNPTDFEKRQLEAVAIAQKATGAAINFHFDYECTLTQRNAALDIVEGAGGDLSRVVVSHVMPRLSDADRFMAMIERGCYLEFDQFGLEVEDALAAKFEDNFDPVATIKSLIDRGGVENLLISQDVCFQKCYKLNGGYGYDDILTNILPKFRAAGITDDQIYTIMVENPQRVFQFKNYAVPEPGTPALLIAGLMGVLGYVWWRRMRAV